MHINHTTGQGKTKILLALVKACYMQEKSNA